MRGGSPARVRTFCALLAHFAHTLRTPRAHFWRGVLWARLGGEEGRGGGLAALAGSLRSPNGPLEEPNGCSRAVRHGGAARTPPPLGGPLRPPEVTGSDYAKYACGMPQAYLA